MLLASEFSGAGVGGMLLSAECHQCEAQLVGSATFQCGKSRTRDFMFSRGLFLPPLWCNIIRA